MRHEYIEFLPLGPGDFIQVCDFVPYGDGTRVMTKAHGIFATPLHRPAFAGCVRPVETRHSLHIRQHLERCGRTTIDPTAERRQCAYES